MRACNNLPQPPKTKMYGLGCGRLLHALTPPRSAFLYLQCLERCHSYILLSFLMHVLSRLSLDCRARRDAIRSTRATRIAYTYAHAYCAHGSCDVWRRSKRKSPRWTWILLSEGQILPYYTTDTSRTKRRPSHVKIIDFKPLIWAVERLY